MSLLDQCNPRIITVDASCGCALTRASIQAWTAADVEAVGLKEIGLDKLLAQQKELRMTGVPQKALMDLLISRMKPGSKSVLGVGKPDSVIAPFSLAVQRHRVNSNYWNVSAGIVTPGAGAGGIPASAWDLTIINDPGTFATSLTNLEKYFLPNKYITVLTQDPVSKVGRTLQFEVISAVNADGGGVSKALVTVRPPYTDTAWALLSAGDKAVYNPETGVVLNLANSVSDYESWCNQYPAENTAKIKEYWWQTIRSTWCYNDAYKEALQAELTGTYFKNFRTISLADQRRRQGMQEERDFYNTIFYGQKINENQTQALYQSLPAVVDPNDTECTLEYKSNTVGIRQQLADCGRVLDMQNGSLTLDTLRSALYSIKRTREADSGTIDRIEVMTNRFTYSLIISVMIDFYKKKYQLNSERFYKLGEKLSFQNFVAWNYCVFEFPEDGFEMAVMHDTYFDDLLGAFPSDISGRGRSLWILDWSDIDIAVASVRSVNRQTNVADNLYNCVITPNVNHYQLQSKTIQVQIQDPNRHLLIENYNANCPTISGTGPCYAYS